VGVQLYWWSPTRQEMLRKSLHLFPGIRKRQELVRVATGPDISTFRRSNGETQSTAGTNLGQSGQGHPPLDQDDEPGCVSCSDLRWVDNVFYQP